MRKPPAVHGGLSATATWGSSPTAGVRVELLGGVGALLRPPAARSRADAPWTGSARAARTAAIDFWTMPMPPGHTTAAARSSTGGPARRRGRAFAVVRRGGDGSRGQGVEGRGEGRRADRVHHRELGRASGAGAASPSPAENSGMSLPSGLKVNLHVVPPIARGTVVRVRQRQQPPQEEPDVADPVPAVPFVDRAHVDGAGRLVPRPADAVVALDRAQVGAAGAVEPQVLEMLVPVEELEELDDRARPSPSRRRASSSSIAGVPLRRR